jgi:hypothetical protein
MKNATEKEIKQIKENILEMFLLYEMSKDQALKDIPEIFGDGRQFTFVFIERYLEEARKYNENLKELVSIAILTEILLDPTLPLEMIANVNELKEEG